MSPIDPANSANNTDGGGRPKQRRSSINSSFAAFTSSILDKFVHVDHDQHLHWHEDLSNRSTRSNYRPANSNTKFRAKTTVVDESKQQQRQIHEVNAESNIINKKKKQHEGEGGNSKNTMSATHPQQQQQQNPERESTETTSRCRRSSRSSNNSLLRSSCTTSSSHNSASELSIKSEQHELYRLVTADHSQICDGRTLESLKLMRNSTDTTLVSSFSAASDHNYECDDSDSVGAVTNDFLDDDGNNDSVDGVNKNDVNPSNSLSNSIHDITANDITANDINNNNNEDGLNTSLHTHSIMSSMDNSKNSKHTEQTSMESIMMKYRPKRSSKDVAAAAENKNNKINGDSVYIPPYSREDTVIEIPAKKKSNRRKSATRSRASDPVTTTGEDNHLDESLSSSHHRSLLSNQSVTSVSSLESMACDEDMDEFDVDDSCVHRQFDLTTITSTSNDNDDETYPRPQQQQLLEPSSSVPPSKMLPTTPYPPEHEQEDDCKDKQEKEEALQATPTKPKTTSTTEEVTELFKKEAAPTTPQVKSQALNSQQQQEQVNNSDSGNHQAATSPPVQSQSSPEETATASQANQTSTSSNNRPQVTVRRKSQPQHRDTNLNSNVSSIMRPARYSPCSSPPPKSLSIKDDVFGSHKKKGRNKAGADNTDHDVTSSTKSKSSKNKTNSGEEGALHRTTSTAQNLHKLSKTLPPVRNPMGKLGSFRSSIHSSAIHSSNSAMMSAKKKNGVYGARRGSLDISAHSASWIPTGVDFSSSMEVYVFEA